MGERERRLGRYELQSVLGTGGMGEVWKAVLHGPQGFRKPVAVKLLRAGPPSPRHRKLLIREARMGAMLSHPNVLSTLELGEAEGVWFIAMELVRGASVGQLLARGALPPAAVIDVAIQTAAGLAHIHGLRIAGEPAGLVHRDIKPENLLVDRQGLVKIADLGVAHRLSEAPDSGAGTPGYMAPEQVEGLEDHRADLFGLGAVVYRMATGERAFGKGMGALAATERVEASLADPRFLAPLDRVSPGLSRVVHRCLRFDPEDRWPSALALGDALTRLRGKTARSITLLETLGQHDPSLEVRTGAMSTMATPSADPTVILGHLPRMLDGFVGRAAERAELAARVVQGGGTLTLMGPGGMGKTRLAIQVAYDVRERMSGGAWFCALEQATSTLGVCQAVASALQLPLGPSDPVEQVGLALAGRGRLLLVLDNVEQAVAVAAPVVAAWARRAPEATLVVTSRIALRVAGEELTSLGPLASSDAVALFRKRAVQAPTQAEAPLVATLVAQLDGMPLAIELAAARTRLLPMQTIVDRLADRFRLLAGGRRDLPTRQRSLHASLEGSWELLDDEARATLGQLSVFAGGFTIEAAEAVVALPGDAWVLDALGTLVDHSLLRRTGRTRFGLLVSIAAFADDKLDPTTRRGAADRHAAFYAQMGSAEALARLHTHGAIDRGRALAAELDNLLRAAAHGVASGALGMAANAALAASHEFRLRGPVQTGIALMDDVLATAPPRRGALLLARAELLSHAGRLDDAMDVAREVLATTRESEDPAMEARALYRIAHLHSLGARWGLAEEHYNEALANFHLLGERGAEASALAGLGNVSRSQGRNDDARDFIGRALALHAEVGNRTGEAVVLANLAIVQHDAGELREATDSLQAALTVHRQAGNPRFEALVLNSLASVHTDRGNPDEAMACYEAALQIHRSVGSRADEALLLGNLALMHRDQGRPAEARRCAERALRVHLEVGHRLAEAVTRGNLGLFLSDEGRHAEAREAFEGAIAACEAVGNPVWVAIEHGYLGRHLLRRGDVEEALGHLQAAVAGAEDRHAQAWASFMADLGEARVATGDVTGHLLLARSEAALRKQDLPELLARALMSRARVQLAGADPEGGTLALGEVARLLDRANAPPASPLRVELAQIVGRG